MIKHICMKHDTYFTHYTSDLDMLLFCVGWQYCLQIRKYTVLRVVFENSIKLNNGGIALHGCPYSCLLVIAST